MSLLIPGTNSIKDTGYDVANSVRLNRGDSPYFQRTPSSASNRRTWTWSGWVKRSCLGSIQTLFDGSDGGYPEIFYFAADDTFIYQHDISGSDYKLISSQVFKDVGAWMHIVVAKDTTQSTETNRLKIYVNGSQITMNESALGYPPQNYEGAININDVHLVGNWKTNSYYIDGYLCEVAFIDGQQLAPTSFGEFDSDSPTIWKPIDVSELTFGTNGFYLDFEDSSNLGNDVSGNNNDYTPNNLAAEDQSIDTCTNNFATFSSLNPTAANFTISQGNLDIYKSGASTVGLYGTTIMPSSGKWYVECKIYEHPSSDAGRVGIANYESIPGDMTTTMQSSSPSSVNGVEVSFGQGDNIMFCVNGVDSENSTFYTAFSNGDVIRMALDLDNGKLYFGVNGNWWNYSSSETGGDPTSGSGYLTNNSNLFDGKPITFYQAHSSGISRTSAIRWNFGSPPYSESGGNSDGNGFGNFNQAVPSGYFALCTKNLAENG